MQRHKQVRILEGTHKGKIGKLIYVEAPNDFGEEVCEVELADWSRTHVLRSDLETIEPTERPKR